ncbi:MAG: NAD(P)-dependent alcohol dehydrogenase [Bacteroidota bacterium]
MNATTMNAVICTQYGQPEVLRYQEVSKPIPKEGELLIKIQAAVAATADTMMRRGVPRYARLFLGLRRPKMPIIGTGFAGIVEATGPGVKHYQPGDAVFGETGVRFSANAEYVCVAEEGLLMPLPQHMRYEEAAPLCDGALTSLNFLKVLAGVQPGQRVLINGASGGLGTAAVQLARYFGAEVTGVCSNRNAELVRALGAQEVIDYNEVDFTQNEASYDIIYDTIGVRSFEECQGALRVGGIYMSPKLSLSLLWRVLSTSVFSPSGKRAKFSATGLQPVPMLRKLLREIVELVEAGHLRTVIDRRYPLSEAVEAHRYVDGGHKRGNVVLVMD